MSPAMSFVSLHTGAPVVDPTAAGSGLGTMMILIVALPALGAAVLLLGGKRTDKWGHLARCRHGRDLLRAGPGAVLRTRSAGTRATGS